MKIFLSYASPDREAARAIERDLTEQGHDVFFDRDDLPPGEEFHARIRRAIEQADLVIFLISPDAVDDGSYSITEIEIAEKSWRRASGKLLPVLLRPTPLESIPRFVRSVTFLETTGNVPAAVAAAVHRLESARGRRRYVTIGLALAAVLLVGLAAWRLSGRESEAEITALDGAPAVLIPAGTFTMGDDEASPQRQVYVDAFYMDLFEVTTGRYADFLAATGLEQRPDGWELLSLPAGEELPVVGVDWNEARAYCDWAGKRLPTEAEWEKAARGTDARRFPWGNESPTLEHANFQNTSPNAYDGGLAPVGTHRAGNSFSGVSDLAGNASEWVSDWYSESFASSDVHNPDGPDAGEQKVIRGGARFDPGEYMAVTIRYYATPTTRREDNGFRCARDAA
jgi:formylglycine-generating enzyme